MNAQIATLRIVTHASTTFYPVIDCLIPVYELVLADLNGISKLHILCCYWHADRHVTRVTLFGRIHMGTICNDRFSLLVLHY